MDAQLAGPQCKDCKTCDTPTGSDGSARHGFGPAAKGAGGDAHGVCNSASPVTPVSLDIMSQGRGRRPVVTALVRRDDGQLLVVKRSDQVSTYRQQWGGVSGGVEGGESLISRALTEILEEVGLWPHQLQLVCFGRPLPVDDGPRHFLVHPFLFQLIDSSAQLTLNWENVGYDWVAPSALPQLNHVPLLPETMRRVLLPPYMQQHIDQLKADRQHGAAQLAAYVLSAVRAALAHEEGTGQLTGSGSRNSSCVHSPPAAVLDAEQQQQQQCAPVQPTFEGFMEAYSNFCFHMAVARPSMAAVANAATSVLLQLQHELAARADAFEPNVGKARLALSDAVSKLSLQLRQQQSATISNMAALLKPGLRVMTTSLSSTVAAALIQAHQQALAAAAARGSEKSVPPAEAQQQEAGPAAAEFVDASRTTDASLTSDVSTRDTPTAGAEPAGDTAAAEGYMSGQGNHQSPTGVEDGNSTDVDDPNFWPSSSGVGRTAISSDTSSWIARLGKRRRAAAAVPEAAAISSSSHQASQSSGPLGVSVVVCESRPLCEGVVMARQLAAAGLDVTVITDAQACVFVGDVDLVLLGADAVTPAGVVNKVGSKLLALAAKVADVPVVAVTDNLKICPGPVSAFALPHTPVSVSEEEKASDELLGCWGQSLTQQVRQLMVKQRSKPPSDPAATSSAAPEAAPALGTTSNSRPEIPGSISIRNVYFECVPLSYLSGLMTDQGLLTGDQVAQLIKQRAQEYQQAFCLAVPKDTLSTS